MPPKTIKTNKFSKVARYKNQYIEICVFIHE